MQVKKYISILTGLALLCAGLALIVNEASAQPDRLNQSIQPNRRITIAGHLHARAIPANDAGLVDPSMPLPAVTLALKPSAEQQTQLETLLREQQDPSSANYHRWLTPETYAQQFGVSETDLDKLTAWLRQQNLTVVSVARGRNSVTISGTAANVGKAFGTEFHHYVVNGRTHFANATEPSVPAPLDLVVKAIHGLNDFRMTPRSVVVAQPDYTSSSGSHYIAPNDLATIYNLTPLYNAGIDGTGQKIVVVGQTDVNLSDLQQFRSYFSLAGTDPTLTLVPKLGDPGISNGDLGEADLDLELAGAVARNASINFVYSVDVTDAVQYAIDQNLAPVISMSYGLCETETLQSDALTMQSWAQQGNAQGITWLAASGDSGGADCAASSSNGGGFAVDAPSSIPEVTGVGGTEFSDASGSFWNTSNDPNRASVKSYIPEVAWNDSAADGSPSASGGGSSIFFLKPTWQSGTGVPSDGARDVPDVALAASADHDGFLMYSAGKLQIVGGTSVAAPTFAGIVALINRQLSLQGGGSGLGNINPMLYGLAQRSPGIFHDVIGGNNIVAITCARARNCISGSYGYNAGTGYDRVTGLGSVDASALVSGWTGQTQSPRSVPALNLVSDASDIISSSTATLTATVTGLNGSTPLGSVTFSYAGSVLGTATLTGSGGVSTASLTISGTKFPLGVNMITAQYSGDTVYATATASVSLTLSAPSSGPPVIGGISNGASFRQSYAPGMVLSIFGSQLAPVTWIADSVPLQTQFAGVSVTVNGVAAPLYYISSSQLNVQIPYEINPGITATLMVQNNGQTASVQLPLAGAAPGIFTDATGALVPAKSASISQVISMYITGGGAVSPTIATGAAPAAGTALAKLPQPLEAVAVSIAGVTAPTQFVGIPTGLVGVIQINFQVPSGVPLGTQPVVVRIGTVTSPPASLTITQ